MVPLSLFYCLFYAVLTEGTTIRVEGVEGGSVSFQCSHRLAWGYNKYFCVDPCESSSSVLVTVAPGKQAASGRIALMDSGNGVFTVTFSQLRLSDSQKYFCGVERTAAIDTYVTVYLTVREDPHTHQPSTPTPEVSSTWTHGAVSSSAQFTSGLKPAVSSNLSAAPNFTPTGEQTSRSTEIILYASIGGAVTVAALILVICIRKCTQLSKPRAPVCCTSRHENDAHEREVDYEYDDIDDIKLYVRNVSQSTAGAQRPPRDSPASSSGAAGCPASHHIYENHSLYKTPPRSACSPATAATSLSATKTKRAGKPSHQPRRLNDAQRRKTSALYNESDEASHISLWFGLEISV
ncbi:uncharacterized protein LOC115390669 [Salarias fasciatus]|uniref:uncharacterized protein LOC115390669 n=1 Tax=Salarias fasciatus TaxID=181472 RepID=UPI001176B06D|nr:uncharacterized protein LOC115390669 [Salarias fasciatus]